MCFQCIVSCRHVCSEMYLSCTQYIFIREYVTGSSFGRDMVIDIELSNHSLWKWFANREIEILMQTVSVIVLQFVFEEIYMGKEFIYILTDLKRTPLEKGFCVIKSVEVTFPFSCVCEINCFFICVFSVWHECIADLTDTRQFTLVVEVTKIYFAMT